MLEVLRVRQWKFESMSLLQRPLFWYLECVRRDLSLIGV